MPNGAVSRRGLLGAASIAAAGMALASGADQIRDEPRLPLLILDRVGLSAEREKQVRQLSPQITLDKSANIAEAQVIFGGIGADDFPKAKKLRWVQYSAAGVESICFPEFVHSEVI